MAYWLETIFGLWIDKQEETEETEEVYCPYCGAQIE